MVSLKDGGMIDDDDFDVDVFFKICFDKELVLGSVSLLTGDDFCVSRRDYFGQLWRRRVHLSPFLLLLLRLSFLNSSSLSLLYLLPLSIGALPSEVVNRRR